MIKSIIKIIVPNRTQRFILHLLRIMEHRANKDKSTEDVFTEIYQNNRWGGKKGEFNSGSGSTDPDILCKYIATIEYILNRESIHNPVLVDLGCGDFRVGSKLLPLCKEYIGVDIVQPIIDVNQQKYGNSTTAFLNINIIDDDLPSGDICTVRQVLQHLSNTQITKILNKLTKFDYVFITEHYPPDSDKPSFNIDKTHGSDIRIYDNSGVYLDKNPFNIDSDKLELILEIEVPALFGDGHDLGYIRTYLYKPGQLDG